jgi:hypothetical protein
MVNPRFASALALAVVLVAPVAPAAGEEPSPPADENKLARDVQNPVGKLTSVPLQNQAEFGIGPYDRVRNTLSIQPTIGIPVTRDVGIVSRTRLPFVSRPEVRQDSGYTSGLGDITESLFVVPHATAGVVWGVGPSFLLPTATPSELGTGKLGIGPSAAVMVQPRPWTFGAVAGQMWSVAGASNRPEVSQLTVMPLVTYHLSGGWYLNSAPVVTANWNAATAGNTWTVPVGGGGGKVFFVDELPINVSAAVYWNAIRPDTMAAPSMTAQLQVALLFPR